MATGVIFLAPLVFIQRELGTALILTLVLVLMVTGVTGSLAYLGLALAGITTGLLFGTLISSHVAERVFGNWWNWEVYAFQKYSENSRYWAGYQPFQALASVHGSGLWGVGLGSGFPKTVPEVKTDYIMVPVFEELGVAGLTIILGGFALISFLGFSGRILPNFRGFLLFGLPLTIVIQTIYNVMAELSIIPLAGLPVPFLSLGGSAILSGYIILAVMAALLNEEKVEAGNVA